MQVLKHAAGQNFFWKYFMNILNLVNVQICKKIYIKKNKKIGLSICF